MADDLRDQTCLKESLLDSWVGSCDLFGVLMATSERLGGAAQEVALPSCALGMLATYYTRTFDPHILRAALLMARMYVVLEPFWRW
jgi:hypothetical protein